MPIRFEKYLKMIKNTTAMVLQVVCVALMVSTEISVLACSLNTRGNIR